MTAASFLTNFAYAVSLLTLLSANIKAKRFRYVLALALLCAEPIFLNVSTSTLRFLVDIAICCALFSEKSRISATLFYALSSVFGLYALAAFYSSIATLLFPTWRHTAARYGMALEIFVLTLYMLILAFVRINNEKSFARFILVLLSLLGVCGFLLWQINRQEILNAARKADEAREQEMRNIYRRVIEFQHVHAGFYQLAARFLQNGDTESLRRLVDEHMKPYLAEIRKSSIAQLENIAPPILREQCQRRLKIDPLMTGES